MQKTTKSVRRFVRSRRETDCYIDNPEMFVPAALYWLSQLPRGRMFTFNEMAAAVVTEVLGSPNTSEETLDRLAKILSKRGMPITGRDHNIWATG